MKKIFFILLSIFIAIAAILTSCEDLIETDYPTNQIGTAQVFDNVHTANSALNDIYAELRTQSFFSGVDTGTGILLGMYTDDIDCYYNDQNGFRDIYLNMQQASNSVVELSWDTAYKIIYAANSIILGVENSTGLNETEKDQIKGEALLIRSVFYFYLQQLFGDIPYTTSIDYEYNRTLSKTNENELLTILSNDLVEASQLLNDDYRHPERIYVNKKVAELMLAKVYLTQGNYSLAEQTIMSVLQSPLYQFQPDLNEVFHNNGNHILWQLQPMVALFPTWESLFFYFTDAPPHAFALTENLVSSFSENDLRKTAWIEPVTFNNQVWYRPNKYKNIDVNPDEYSVVIRIEEAYFIMAEALARQNRISEALPYINMTRERAGLQPLGSVSQEVLITELLNERRREFFTEFGHRFIDLKRLEKLHILSGVKPNWVESKKVWPIPQKELLLNPNLNPQNEGY